MNELIKYLRANILVDFQAALSIELVQELLGSDEGADARRLLTKLVESGNTDDLILTLSDCLLPVAQKALSSNVMLEQLTAYTES